MTTKKDPAILFYPDLFLTGTRFFTWEQKGKYIDLLLLAHQHGGILEKEDFHEIVCNDKKLLKKFKECDDGFYNERLLFEMNKRNKKSNNLSENAKKRWSDLDANAMQMQCNCNAIAKPPKDRNKNRNINKDKDINKDKIPFKLILDDLNDRIGLTGKDRYSHMSAKTVANIKERWAEGFRYEDFIKVHENKYKEWKGTDFEKFIRPYTLYSDKFETYLKQPDSAKRAELKINFNAEIDLIKSCFGNIEKVQKLPADIKKALRKMGGISGFGSLNERDSRAKYILMRKED